MRRALILLTLFSCACTPHACIKETEVDLFGDCLTVGEVDAPGLIGGCGDSSSCGGVSAQFSVSPKALDLSEGAAHPITITNVGTVNLRLDALDLVDAHGVPTTEVFAANDATDQWLDPPTECTQIWLAPNASITLDLVWTDDNDQPDTHRLIIESNVPLGPVEVTLQTP